MDFLSKLMRSKQHSSQAHKSDCAKKVHEEPQSQLKVQVNSPASETEEKSSEETTKENYNPKSLSEIAAEQKLKTPSNFFENNITSTPKFVVTKENFKEVSSDFELDDTINLTPRYSREAFSDKTKDFGLSFLTDGLNRLGLDSLENHAEHSIETRSNVTFSDDDEQFVECQSFTDLSNHSASTNTVIKDDSDVMMRTVCIDGSGNDTLTNDGMGDDVEDIILNKTETLSGNKTFDTAEGEPVGFANNQSHEKSASPADGGFLGQLFESPVTLKVPKLQSPITPSQEIQSPATPRQDIQSPITPRLEIQSSLTQEAEAASPMVQEVACTSPMAEEVDVEQVATPRKQDFQEVASPVMERSYRNIDERVSPVKQEVQVASPAAEKSFDKVDQIPFEKTDTSLNERNATFNESLRTSESPCQTQQLTPETPFHVQQQFTATPSVAKSPIVEQSPSTSLQKLSENFFMDTMESRFEVEFKMPAAPVLKQQPTDGFKDEDFKTCGSSYNFGESDFDYLQKFGSADDRKSLFQRDSLLLKFDPLLAHLTSQNKRLSATKEEDDYVADFELKLPTQEEVKEEPISENNSFGSCTSANEQSTRQLLPHLEDEMSMSVDIMKDISVENKTSESNHIECEENKLSSHHNEEFRVKMADMENKIKKEAEMREEALLKRISEKDKQITKMNGVVEAYEKAISELIAEKEQLVQSYEKKCNDLKNDSELNANHLTSLETTFSDLHAKYERTKQVAMELKDREEMILQDRKTLTDNLKMQEARYDKMKSHAMSQLEIANSTLAEINRTHNAEVTKLKAHLKKEEISRASINEQLIQKTKENSELVKICDELINGTSSSS